MAEHTDSLFIAIISDKALLPTCAGFDIAKLLSCGSSGSSCQSGGF